LSLSKNIGMLASIDREYEKMQNKQLSSIWIMMWISFIILISMIF